MRRSRFFLVCMLLIGSLVVCGCGRRLVATVQADTSSLPVPAGLSWAAVPGSGWFVPATSATSAPILEPTGGTEAAEAAELSGLNLVASPLAGALMLYDWKWISNPAEAAVLIRIGWETSGPEYVLHAGYYGDPFFQRPSSTFGFGLGTGWGTRGYRQRRSGFFGGSRYGYGYAEPSIQTVYARTLTLEAVRVDAVSPAIRAALLASAGVRAASSLVSASSTSTSPRSVPDTPTSEELSRPPYAPALSVNSNGSAQAPYAPPLLELGKIPAEAILWRVVVTSTGSRGNTRELLPQLIAAALPLVGKNAEVNVVVDSELQVTYQ